MRIPHRAPGTAVARSGAARRVPDWPRAPDPSDRLRTVACRRRGTPAAFAELAQDSSDFAAWFRAQVKEVSGVDLTAPPEGGPELVLDWEA